MKQQARWKAVTLALFAWFFVYKSSDGENAHVGATPVVIGPFETERQCRTVREEMIGTNAYSGSVLENEVRFGSRYISQCWRSVS